MVIITKHGYFKRFNLEEVRPMGRLAPGIEAILLREDDEVAAMQVVKVGVKSSEEHGRNS